MSRASENERIANIRWKKKNVPQRQFATLHTHAASHAHTNNSKKKKGNVKQKNSCDVVHMIPPWYYLNQETQAQRRKKKLTKEK